MEKSFLYRKKTLIILLLSGISNYLHFYASFFERENYNLMNIISLVLISVFGGVITSILIAGILWLSVPLYECFSGENNKYQGNIPFQVFLIIVAFINVIYFVTDNETFATIIIKFFNKEI